MLKDNIKKDLKKFNINIDTNIDTNVDINDDITFDKYFQILYKNIINKFNINGKQMMAIIDYLKYDYEYNELRKGLSGIILDDIMNLDKIFVKMNIDKENNRYKTDENIGSICKVIKANGKGQNCKWYVMVENMKIMELNYVPDKINFEYVIKDSEKILEIRKHKKINEYVLANDIKKRNMQRINKVIFSY